MIKKTLPLISIITTVKNRLHHLKETLPYMCNQSNAEVIVVDYGCSQGSAKWVRSNFKQVKVIKYDKNPNFCLSCARNIGAKNALGKILFFLDVDQILNDDLGKWIEHNVNKKSFYEVGEPRSLSSWGELICYKSDFNNIEGYDEAFSLWGGEDRDIIIRLSMKNKKHTFPSKYLTAIEHTDSERDDSLNNQLLSKKELLKICYTYINIKYDVMSLVKQKLDVKYRKILYDKIKNEVLSIAELDCDVKRNIEINLPEPKNNRLAQIYSRKLIYTI